MAAASAASAASGPEPALAAVSAFLTAATELHRALVSVHRHGEGHAAPADFEALSARLGEATAALGAAEAAPLASACRRVALELRRKLARLADARAVVAGRVVDPAAFRTAWSARDVEALGSRLRGLVGQRSDEAIVFGVSHLRHTGDGRPAAPDTSGREAADADDSAEAAAEHGIEDAGGETAGGGRIGLFTPSAAVAGAIHEPRPAAASLLCDFILDSLAYKSMHAREEEVVRAHRSTFEWVFADANSPADDQGGRSGDRLAGWLATDGLAPIYWITGKPGSGKSTLMRFLFHHPLTAARLQAWARGLPVQTAGFFFWTSGPREQRSQTGLLRSLLHQLLAHNRELMPSTFPALWETLRNMSTRERIGLAPDWPVRELMRAFRLFTDAALPRIKICLFVDGLDEFDRHHLSLIDFFRDLGLGEHGRAIKMCLSSRPWPVFENAFEHAVPRLRLQDLTCHDMHRYATDRLEGSARIRRLLRGNADARRKLVGDVVERADGVFLWVRLAVDEMMDKFRPAPDASSLSDVLAQLPTELDGLFGKLLFEDQTDTELAETAVIFQLMRAREVVAGFVRDDSAHSLTVWELAFALDEADDGLALEAVVQEATDAFIRDRCESTATRIGRRFAGLLDVHGPSRQADTRAPRFADEDDDAVGAARTAASKRVSYTHRTVRDWLMDADGIRGRLVAASPAGFDPHLRLLRSHVLRLKRPLAEVEHHRRLDEWWPDVSLAMTHARHVAVDAARLQRPLLNELDGTLSWLWRRRPQDAHDRWARNAFGSYEVRMKAPPMARPFLCLAAKFGLTRYVSEELAARGQQDDDDDDDGRGRDATPLLSHATEFLCSRKATIFPLSDPELVGHLLRSPCRASPGANHPYVDFTTRAPTTPWLALLRHLRDARRRGWIAHYDTDPRGTARWAAIVRLFVDVGGADVDAVVAADRWDPEISAVGVLELLEATYGAVEVRELRELMVAKKGAGQGEETKQVVLRPRSGCDSQD
ncbi:NACHT nucleoside triphosphatase [Tolypocladium capitatum]|uniref:NACHT nucleoside triphosphatase n=1 Tax=Tolypocladium capitatum TaxID=45235 RepID=A0A2K3QPZ0_9HYPO|nr:NACHT nucleoside triphosphatase [Tolypocladium capitatum]